MATWAAGFGRAPWRKSRRLPMSDRNPYAELGDAEDASFEQIQDAKNRLMREHKDDSAVLESVEAA